MESKCTVSRVELLDWIEGKAGDTLTPHVESCSKCQAQAEAYRKLIHGLANPLEQPSVTAVAAAKELGNESRARLAPRVQSGLSAIPVRGEASEIMLVRAAGDDNLRLHYTKQAKGWIMRTRIQAGATCVHGDQVFDSNEEGWIEVLLADLEHEDLLMAMDGNVYRIPNPMVDE